MPNLNGRKSIRLITNTYLPANKNAKALPGFQAAIAEFCSLLREDSVNSYRSSEHNKTRNLAIAGRAFVVSFGFPCFHRAN